MAQSPGDRWLDPASEDFNMTKAMTLGKGGRGSSTGCVGSSWMVQPRSPAAAIANQQGDAINHHVSRVSPQLALLPGASLDKERSLQRIGTLRALLSS